MPGAPLIEATAEGNVAENRKQMGSLFIAALHLEVGRQKAHLPPQVWDAAVQNADASLKHSTPQGRVCPVLLLRKW